ncbi:MAG: hypothetical protein IH846_15470 [Acidobacteria bacterium]|nr:hypothetical protein [Acidobacteriota bacterium]
MTERKDGPYLSSRVRTTDYNGNGTLHVTKTGPSYAALGALGAMSIRLGATGALQAWTGPVEGGSSPKLRHRETTPQLRTSKRRFRFVSNP